MSDVHKPYQILSYKEGQLRFLFFLGLESGRTSRASSISVGFVLPQMSMGGIHFLILLFASSLDREIMPPF
jgi:hypothetical protein